MKYEFIGKCIFLPKQEILAIGDMHLGYEYTLRETGSLMPATQFKQTKEDLEKVFNELKKEKKNVKKVIFLGDVKHFFAFNKGEKNLFLEILLLIGEHVKREDIIVLKGNHEKMAEIADKQLVNYYIEENIAFIHGDVEIKEAFDKRINYIIMGHLHPAITLADSQRIKHEKYKCFFMGEYKRKKVIILPSFLPIIEGTSLNEYLREGACIIPVNKLRKFEVHAIGQNRTFNFGKLNKLLFD